MTITNSTFARTSPRSTHIGQSAFGGAIAADPGSARSVVGSTFAANSATNLNGTGGNGGAIWFVPETDTGSALSVINRR